MGPAVKIVPGMKICIVTPQQFWEAMKDPRFSRTGSIEGAIGDTYFVSIARVVIDLNDLRAVILRDLGLAP